MNISKLKGVIPDAILAALTPDFLTKATIDGPRRLSNFLGQCMTESGNFRVKEENLHYTAAGLEKIFPKYFPKKDHANFAMQPEKIGNRVYANRNGNGNEASGDGYRYRGRGYLQITGKANYGLYATYAGVDSVGKPDLLMQPPHDLNCAVWFFTKNHLWTICDKGVDMATVTEVTEHVNGGHNGLQERFEKTQRVFNAVMG